MSTEEEEALDDVSEKELLLEIFREVSRIRSWVSTIGTIIVTFTVLTLLGWLVYVLSLA